MLLAYNTCVDMGMKCMVYCVEIAVYALPSQALLTDLLYLLPFDAGTYLALFHVPICTTVYIEYRKCCIRDSEG
jgi:hypothetical protein